MNISIDDLENSVEDLVRELSEKQKILNIYGNQNRSIQNLFTGFQYKTQLINAFKLLLSEDNEKVFSALDEYKTICTMKDQVEETKTRVKEIRKLLDI